MQQTLFRRHLDISTHPPMKGGTHSARSTHKPRTHFNPPAREGRDWMRSDWIEAVGKISTHPPVKGGTPREAVPHWSRRNFNPPAREGRDDAQPCSCTLKARYFNPPAREGRDPQEPLADHRDGISTHPPVKGGTHDGLSQPICCHRFQPTRP